MISWHLNDIICSFSDLFHPDNIKNFSDKDHNVSNSLEKYWNRHGGPTELAKHLRTSLKVSLELFDITDKDSK